MSTETTTQTPIDHRDQMRVMDKLPIHVHQWAIQSQENFDAFRRGEVPESVLKNEKGFKQDKNTEVRTDADLSVQDDVIKALGVPKELVADGTLKIIDGKIDGKYASMKEYLVGIQGLSKELQERKLVDDKGNLIEDESKYAPNDKQVASITAAIMDQLVAKHAKDLEGYTLDTQKDWDDFKIADPDLWKKMDDEFRALYPSYHQATAEFNKTKTKIPEIEAERATADSAKLKNIFGIDLPIVATAKDEIYQKYMTRDGFGDPRYFERVNGVNVLREGAISSYIINERADDVRKYQEENANKSKAEREQKIQQAKQQHNGTGATLAGVASQRTDLGAESLPTEEEYHDKKWRDRYIIEHGGFLGGGMKALRALGERMNKTQ